MIHLFNFLISSFSHSFFYLFGRESRDPKSKSSQKKSKYSSPFSKQKDSPAKFRDEEDFSSEKAAGRLSSGSRHYDNAYGSKKGRDIKG